MKTIIYLIRNAEKLPVNATVEYSANDSNELQIEKQILGINGEMKAEQLANVEELQNINIIYSSHFVSAIGTAKYLADKLDIRINIDERFGERKIGDLDKKNSKMFVYSGEHDFDYKIGNSESINEAKYRFTRAFNEILDMNLGKQIAIFSHETIIISFLLNFCEAQYNLEDKLILTFNELNIATRLTSPDCFKLTIEDKEVINIERIEL